MRCYYSKRIIGYILRRGPYNDCLSVASTLKENRLVCIIWYTTIIWSCNGIWMHSETLVQILKLKEIYRLHIKNEVLIQSCDSWNFCTFSLFVVVVVVYTSIDLKRCRNCLINTYMYIYSIIFVNNLFCDCRLVSLMSMWAFITILKIKCTYTLLAEAYNSICINFTIIILNFLKP